MPLYVDRPITVDELRGKTLRELELMRATIFARAGLVFLDRWLRDYLAEAPWYEPGRYDASRLSAVDVGNLRTLELSRARISRTELKNRWSALLFAHRYAGRLAMQARLAFSEDGAFIAAGSSPIAPQVSPLSIFRAATGERINLISWAKGNLYDLRFVRNQLVVVSNYEARSGEVRSRLARSSLTIGAAKSADGSREPPPYWACISPDGTKVLSRDGAGLTSFDLTTAGRGLTYSLPTVAGAPSGAVLLPDTCAFLDSQRVFVKPEQFGVSCLLDLGSPKAVALAVPPGNSVIAPNARWLARWERTPADETSAVEVWKLGSRPERARVLSGSAGTRRAVFSPDGTQLVTADAEGRLVHWAALNELDAAPDRIAAPRPTTKRCGSTWRSRADTATWGSGALLLDAGVTLGQRSSHDLARAQ